MRPDEVQTFFEDLAAQLRHRGIVCAITSGLACVHYGIAETTKDCDLLCNPHTFPNPWLPELRSYFQWMEA